MSAAVRPPISRPRRRPESRPEELLDAALAVFGERGFRSATLEEVASRAGVSKGTVYLYFSSKEALFQEVVARKIVSRVMAAEELTRNYHGPIMPLLEQLITRLWEFISLPEFAAMSRVMQAELPQFPELHRYYFEQVVQRHRQLLREVMLRGVTSGEIRSAAVDQVATLIPALVIHLNQRRSLFAAMDADSPSASKELEMILSLLRHGILCDKQPYPV